MFYFLFLLSSLPIMMCSDLWYRDCGGSDEYIKFDSVSISPYPIKYPGNISVTEEYTVLKDIDDNNAQISFSMDKLTPKRMHIPCLNDYIGSCTYKYCDQYDKNPLLLMFGIGKCPFTKGKVTTTHPSKPFPSFGSIFEKIMEGDFEVNVTFHNENTKQLYSCFQFRMTIELNK